MTFDQAPLTFQVPMVVCLGVLWLFVWIMFDHWQNCPIPLEPPSQGEDLTTAELHELLGGGSVSRPARYRFDQEGKIHPSQN